MRVPTHPARAAEHWSDRYRLLSREEAALLAAELAARPDRGLAAFLKGFDADLGRVLDPGIALARSIDGSTETPDACLGLRYDGYLPDGLGWERHFSARPAHLARCPQTFFFAKVLGTPAGGRRGGVPLRIAELGSLVHKILERVFRDLAEKSCCAADDAKDLVAPGSALRRHWKTEMAPVRSACAPITRSVGARGARLAGRDRGVSRRRPGSGPPGAGGGGETLSEADGAPPARGALLRARGEEMGRTTFRCRCRFWDPRLRVTGPTPTPWLVSDYKTAGNLARRVDGKGVPDRRGGQAPLYVLLAEADGAPAKRAELLGVGPAYLPDGGSARTGPAAGPRDFADRAGFEETLGGRRLGRPGGRFPLHRRPLRLVRDLRVPPPSLPVRGAGGGPRRVRDYFRPGDKGTQADRGRRWGAAGDDARRPGPSPTPTPGGRGLRFRPTSSSSPVPGRERRASWSSASSTSFSAGAQLEQITAITFTEKAAGEMRERVAGRSTTCSGHGPDRRRRRPAGRRRGARMAAGERRRADDALHARAPTWTCSTPRRSARSTAGVPISSAATPSRRAPPEFAVDAGLTQELLFEELWPEFLAEELGPRRPGRPVGRRWPASEKRSRRSPGRRWTRRPASWPGKATRPRPARGARRRATEFGGARRGSERSPTERTRPVPGHRLALLRAFQEGGAEALRAAPEGTFPSPAPGSE